MQPNPQRPQKKRLLIAAGLFILPAVAIGIAIAGLLGAHKKPATKSANGSAFNTELPSPNLPKSEKNKLEIYMQAQADSIKQNQERAEDPYGRGIASQSTTPVLPGKPGGKAAAPGSDQRTGIVTSPFIDDNDKKVTDCLQKIYAALGSSAPPPLETKTSPIPPAFSQTPESPEVAKLEKLMAAFQKSDTTIDPQLQQVKQVLDEIKDIQHPEKSKPDSALGGHNVPALRVETRPPVQPDSSSLVASGSDQNGFFGLSDETDAGPVAGSAIEVIIHSDQTVLTGSIVELRLLQDIYIGSNRIPANSFIHGRCSVEGERVDIQLTNAIYDGNIYPIKMKVYDGVDGLEGLYVPGAITRDAIKEGMGQGVSGMSIGTLDPSLGAQAAAAGIETAKSLLGRKIRLVKVTLKAGHIALLKNPDTLR